MARPRRPADPRQPDLFAPRAPGWVDLLRPPNPADELQHSERAMLLLLARQEAEAGFVEIAIPRLAEDLGIVRNTCRRHLEALMAAGLIVIRPITKGRQMLGYDVRLVFDDEDRAAALAEGFAAQRGRAGSRRSVTACR